MHTNTYTQIFSLCPGLATQFAGPVHNENEESLVQKLLSILLWLLQSIKPSTGPIYTEFCETAKATGPRRSLSWAFIAQSSGRINEKVEGYLFQELAHQ